MVYDPRWRLVWSLAASGVGTTISGAGNSGALASVPPSDYTTCPVDLGDVTDVGLFVYCGVKTASPTFTVSLSAFTEGGNLVPLLSTAGITAAGVATPVFGGLHGPTAGTYFVLPHWGQVSWTLTGSAANFGGVEISLFGR